MGGILYDSTRAAQAMDDAGLDAVVALTPPNVQYLTRFRRAGSGVALLRRDDVEHPELFVTASNISFCLEDPCEAATIKAHGTFYRSFNGEVELTEREQFMQRLHHETRTDANAWQLMAESLQEASLDKGAIGVDGPADSLANLQAILPDLCVKSVPQLFRRLRMVKSEEEIRRLAEAARITEHAILTSAQSAFLGATQRHLARTFSLTAITANAFVRQDNASIDGGSAFGNLNTPGDLVRDGSIIRYDVGVHYQGYASDIARCFGFRSVPDRAKRYHDALVEGLYKLLACIRPGAMPADIFHATVEAVRKAGLPGFERTHVGHGIGIAGAGYDPPMLSPKDETPLEPGMVLCVETPYSEVGFAGLQVEDMIVVTEDGYRSLTHSERSLQIVP